MSAPAASSDRRRLDARQLDGIDEPVRRYFAHALTDGAPLADRVRLEVSGSIRVGTWLRFGSVWVGDGRSFSWEATAGPFAFLHVHDEFRDGVGVMDVRLRPPLKLELVHAENADVARSGAGRAALEALWTPAALLPDRGVRWRAESDELIVATWDVPPERPDVHITIARDGAVRSYRALRWRDAEHGYVPFGAAVHAERTFGALTIPSRLTAGWGSDTAAWLPFFRMRGDPG